MINFCVPRLNSNERDDIGLRSSAIKQSRSKIGTVGLFIFVMFFAAAMVLPMILIICNSFKPLNELWEFPPKLYVKNPTIQNYTDMFNIMSDSMVPFSRYLLNTVSITAVGTAGHILISSMCAYPLAKKNFTGKNVIFKIIQSALMFNATVMAIPTYLVISKLQLIDSLWALILPAFATPLGLYLMKQFMEQAIPDALIEAASIDGASQFKVFFRIVMPNVKPAWMTLILLCVQSLWQTGQSTVIFSEQKKTLAYALSQIAAGGVARAGISAAVSVVMMSVPVGIFLFTQSNILQTMASSGMKD